MILLIKADHSIYGGFPVVIVRVFPVAIKKRRHPRLRIPVIIADNIAQFPFGADALLMEWSLVYHVEQASGQYRQCFIDDEAVTDENFGKGPAVTRLRAITEPAFGNIEQSIPVYK
jgi:hypothetical protein